LILVRPLNRVEIDIPHLISDQEFLCVDESIVIPDRAAALRDRSEADIGDWSGLLAVEPWFRILWAPECDPPIATPDGENG
jgi:hypothetical protein